MSQDRKKRSRKGGEGKQQAGGQSLCGTMASGESCCRVEALVSIDERGQMILPKELRERANIRAGDKFAVTSMGKNGKVCCIVLTKAEDLSGMVMNVIGPVVKNMTETPAADKERVQ
jgi:AbrB family looped-hinge helix DNA binding protein